MVGKNDKRKRESLNLSIEAELIKKLKKIAIDRDTDASSLMEDLIRQLK